MRIVSERVVNMLLLLTPPCGRWCTTLVGFRLCNLRAIVGHARFAVSSTVMGASLSHFNNTVRRFQAHGQPLHVHVNVVPHVECVLQKKRNSNIYGDDDEFEEDMQACCSNRPITYVVHFCRSDQLSHDRINCQLSADMSRRLSFMELDTCLTEYIFSKHGLLSHLS